MKIISALASNISFRIFFSLITCIISLVSAAASTLTITVKENSDNSAIEFATCTLRADDSAATKTEMTDDHGRARFDDVAPGKYKVEISYMSHTHAQSITVGNAGRTNVTIYVRFNPHTLSEVVITAREGGQMTSSSVIGREAIGHIQPSSFADLLELIPGGSAKDPQFGSPQSIRLREADPVASYATSSLGTQFMVDGVPINNDANLQSTPISSNYGSSFTGEGVDMRSVSTDNIEKVEIVRGIPSVEYGDLTSGLIKIERKRGGNNFEARMKADMASKLFSAGKGFDWNSNTTHRTTLNLDLSYLNAANDPRNTRQSYKRLTGSIRARQQWGNPAGLSFAASLSADYTGSFDDVKADRDLDDGVSGPIETYKSKYNRFAASAEFSIKGGSNVNWFRSLDITASFTGENDRIERWKVVEPGMDTPVCTALEPGIWDAFIVPYTYNATLAVDGKPQYFYANAVSNWKIPAVSHNFEFKFGVNFNSSSNRGEGTIFDLERPFSIDMNVRPRVFKDIPAINQFHWFAENNTTLKLGTSKVKLMAGVRAMTLAGLDSRYKLSGEWKYDARFSLRYESPRYFLAGRASSFAVTGGWGEHTKFPTAEQLWPDAVWYDLTEFNYWPSNPELRRVSMKVFRNDFTNYGLDAARNKKAEVSLELNFDQYFLTATLFREDMTSGFRNSNTPVIYNFRLYDINSAPAGAVPSPENCSYSDEAIIVAHNFINNGSRTLKTGVEFTLGTPRFAALHTRFTVSGAYFRTRYTNSQPEYYRPSTSIGGKAFPYIGYYASTDNYLRERFNTNFSTDTQLPNFGLVFSTSFQCVWFTGSQNDWRDPNPIEYVDTEGNRFLFTTASAEDGVLRQLIRSFNNLAYVYNRVPFAMNINLKIAKSLYHDRITLSLFANKLLDVSPSYYSALGVKVRREVNPYFGMELNIKL